MSLPHTAGHGIQRQRTLEALPKICQRIRGVALALGVAAVAEGVPARTIKRYDAKGKVVLEALLDWEEAADAAMERGEEPPPVPVLNQNEAFYAHVAWEIEQARGGALTARLARIAEGKPGWQASAWIVERNPVWRADYAPPQRVELSGLNGGPIETLQVVVADRNEGRAALGLPPLVIVRKGSEG